MGATHSYQVFVPKDYTPAVKWPVILFGHGSGEKGDNNTAQVGVGLGPYVRANEATFPAIVVFPQQPPRQRRSRHSTAPMIVMLDATMRKANIDSTRRVPHRRLGRRRARMVAGDSTYPDRFAALPTPMSALR